MTDAQQRAAAKKFAAEWRGRGEEKSDTHLFWMGLLRIVFGVEDVEQHIQFEKPVLLDHKSWIDAYLPDVPVLIEQKSLGINLLEKQSQSDGSELTPYQQAKRYADNLSNSERPRYIVTCNFETFLVYDLEKPHSAPECICLADLPKEYYRLAFLTGSTGASHLKREMEVSLQAGEIVGQLYDEILKHYNDPTSPTTLKSLNMLCVRLVFCLYAEDAGIFGQRNQFHDYLNSYEPRFLRAALIELFKILDTPQDQRDPYLDDVLAAFPYVNGGLFSDEAIEIPQLDETVKTLLLTQASNGFDWSVISPTIFGAVFESTLNPETRRSGGMHYTSIENIHKVIDPLFLTDLCTEFAEIKAIKAIATRNKRLAAFQHKLATLIFLDPACGSGNFLTETYLSLRRLENDVIALRTNDNNTLLALEDIIQVSIRQFYGIEINDFAVTVAKTALWISESQMMKETETIVKTDLDFLPLKTNANITEANALSIDWATIIPPNRLNYIMGNPPFIGARLMGSEQKADVLNIFGEDWKNTGNLDYVACWYKKATDLIQGTSIHCALVSTNSITQGEQPAILWKPLMESGIRISFAYRTFRWDSEAKSKAHVHCVIVGFHWGAPVSPILFDEAGKSTPVGNINAYLIDAPNTFIESRSKPICPVPEIGIGNKPIDGGNYLFTADERDAFIKQEPDAVPFFKEWYGSFEFINRQPRYCLWLGDCSPVQLRRLPACLKRVEAVRSFRLESKSEGTRKIADKPTRFHVENMPTTNYIVVPEVSSEKRRYIPMGFMTPDMLCSNLVKIIPDATLYHFGVLTSAVHMGWMRAVCGRLKSDYRYSKDIVYNNFPWPTVTPAQEAKIAATAQAILDARALYPDCSLADLYDEVTMPQELRKAHQTNDRVVSDAYGFSSHMTEPDIVAALMLRYQTLTQH